MCPAREKELYKWGSGFLRAHFEQHNEWMCWHQTLKTTVTFFVIVKLKENPSAEQVCFSAAYLTISAVLSSCQLFLCRCFSLKQYSSQPESHSSATMHWKAAQRNLAMMLKAAFIAPCCMFCSENFKFSWNNGIST